MNFETHSPAGHPFRYVTPTGHRPLHFEGKCDMYGHWVEGRLVTGDSDECYPVQDGIPRFHFGSGHGWDDDSVRVSQFRKMGVDEDKLIERNWDYMVNQWPEYPYYESWIRKIADTAGPIIEIAVGPGGGVSPLLLNFNPDAHVLMTDIGLWPLRQWHSFAERMGYWPNLRFAQFDAARMPLADNSVSAVVSWGGISNIGTRQAALKEARRVLRPGGTLYALEFLPDHVITPRCPPQMIELLREKYPQMGVGFRPLLTEVGFSPVRVRNMGSRPLVPGEGGLADFCAKYEVVMHLIIYRIRAVKPV